MWYFHTLPSLSILLSHILLISHCLPFFFFFFNDTATTEIYTLSLHDALPISIGKTYSRSTRDWTNAACCCGCGRRDRKSTRLNSSHLVISYAVFCLKKKKKEEDTVRTDRDADSARSDCNSSRAHRMTMLAALC